MFQWLYEIWYAITKFFDVIIGFLSEGIYTFFEQTFVYMLQWMILVKINVAILSLEVVSGILMTLYGSLNVGGELQLIWSNIPLEIRQILSFFRVPQAITIIMSAYVTRAVIRMIPFL